jgi:hypothetical protein
VWIVYQYWLGGMLSGLMDDELLAKLRPTKHPMTGQRIAKSSQRRRAICNSDQQINTTSNIVLDISYKSNASTSKLPLFDDVT